MIDMRPWAILCVLLGMAALAPIPLHGQDGQLNENALVSYEDDLFAAIARAGGIPDLRGLALPDGHREIRIRNICPCSAASPRRSCG